MTWPFGVIQPLSADLIMADPPWRHETRSQKGVTSKSAGYHYATMSIDDIAALPVVDLCRGDAVLWLWATHAMIDQQIDVARRWGFTFSTTGVWVKRTVHNKIAFGTGQRLRCASEPFIIATIGKPRTSRSVRTVVEAKIREHSRKPDEAYEIAEALYPKALCRIDLFARQTRPGWIGWGLEKEKFDIQPREKS